jgi:hypothetical protein
VAIEVFIGIEVEAFLSELVEEAELLNRPDPLQTLEANPVDPTTGLGERRQATSDRTNVTARAVEVSVGSGGTRSADTLVVDVKPNARRGAS